MRNVHFEVRHRQGVNRNGRKVTLRHASLPGFLAVDRKTGEWCYKERRDNNKLEPVIQSKGWAEYMDAMKPDYVPITYDWVKKIQLRQRAFN